VCVQPNADVPPGYWSDDEDQTQRRLRRSSVDLMPFVDRVLDQDDQDDDDERALRANQLEASVDDATPTPVAAQQQQQQLPDDLQLTDAQFDAYFGLQRPAQAQPQASEPEAQPAPTENDSIFAPIEVPLDHTEWPIDLSAQCQLGKAKLLMMRMRFRDDDKKPIDLTKRPFATATFKTHFAYATVQRPPVRCRVIESLLAAGLVTYGFFLPTNHVKSAPCAKTWVTAGTHFDKSAKWACKRVNLRGMTHKLFNDETHDVFMGAASWVAQEVQNERMERHLVQHPHKRAWLAEGGKCAIENSGQHSVFEAKLVDLPYHNENFTGFAFEVQPTIGTDANENDIVLHDAAVTIVPLSPQLAADSAKRQAVARQLYENFRRSQSATEARRSAVKPSGPRRRLPRKRSTRPRESGAVAKTSPTTVTVTRKRKTTGTNDKRTSSAPTTAARKRSRTTVVDSDDDELGIFDSVAERRARRRRVSSSTVANTDLPDEFDNDGAREALNDMRAAHDDDDDDDSDESVMGFAAPAVRKQTKKSYDISKAASVLGTLTNARQVPPEFRDFEELMMAPAVIQSIKPDNPFRDDPNRLVSTNDAYVCTHGLPQDVVDIVHGCSAAFGEWRHSLRCRQNGLFGSANSLYVTNEALNGELATRVALEDGQFVAKTLDFIALMVRNKGSLLLHEKLSVSTKLDKTALRFAAFQFGYSHKKIDQYIAALGIRV
jgi:hypothetical protein